MTFDSWTSRANQNFLAITGHFWSETKRELETVLLDFIDVSEISHTAENLADVIRRNIVEKYPKKVFHCAVTDSASNMIATVKRLNIEHLPCIAHKVQTVVNSTLLMSTSKAKKITESENDINFEE